MYLFIMNHKMPNIYPIQFHNEGDIEMLDSYLLNTAIVLTLGENLTMQCKFSSD